MIRYVVEGNLAPITIWNNIGVKLYIDIKKKESEFGMYPICIDTFDLDVVEMQTFDGANEKSFFRYQLPRSSIQFWSIKYLLDKKIIKLMADINYQ